MDSDHAPLLVSLRHESANASSRRQVTGSFDYSKADWSLFRGKLDSDWLSASGDDVDTTCNLINNAIIAAAEAAIPRSTHARRRNRLPPHILALIKERQEVRKRSLKDSSLKPAFNSLTSRIRAAVSENACNRWQAFLDKIGPNRTSSKPFWAKINETRSNKSTKGKTPPLHSNSSTATTDKEKAEMFRESLSRAFTGSSGHHDNEHKARVEAEVKRFLANVDSSEHCPVSIDELKLAVSALPRSSAPGPSKIHNEMLKQLPNSTLQSIVDLTNLTLRTGKVPAAWKDARVTMLPKGRGASTDPSCYRPISVTCCLSKLVERVLNKRMYTLLENNGFFVACQSGFRSRRRTTDNFFYLTQKIKENLCRRKKVCCFLFDISKAFDNIWHVGLLHKMIRAKLPPQLIRWTADFLTGRSFQVVVEQESSSNGSIFAGVPQGAVLSPLLFNVFINDVPTGDSKNKSHSLLFADDLSTIFIFKRQGNLTSTAQRYLNQLSKWLYINRLQMNASKCSYTIFANGNSSPEFNFELNGTKIGHEKHPKLLGSELDQRVSFCRNVDVVSRKCASRLNIIKILSHSSWRLDKRTLLNIYRALIGSLIDGCAFHHATMAKATLAKLQTIQNSAIRTIFRLPRDTPTANLNAISGLGSVSGRLRFLCNQHLCSAVINRNPLITNLIDQFLDSYNSIITKSTHHTPLCAFLGDIT